MAKIILLNGPPAAGKTTVSKLFIKEQEPVEWAYISQDDIRQSVKSGYGSADKTRDTWDKRTKSQWLVGIENCVDLAVNFQQMGISCIVDFYATETEFKHWKELLKGVDFVHVVLIPGITVDLARNAGRKLPAHLTNKKITESYKEFEGWATSRDVILIDNSSQTPKQTVELLVSLTKNLPKSQNAHPLL